MKRWLAFGFLGVTTFIVILAATLPAKILTRQVSNYAPIHFTFTKGTLWNGSVEEIITPEMPDIVLGPVSWRLSPWCLFKLQLCLHLVLEERADNLQGSARITAKTSGVVDVRDAHVDINSQWLMEIANVPLNAEGILQLTVARLTVNPDNTLPQVNAKLIWRNATLSLLQRYEFGDYQIELEHQPEDAPNRLMAKFKDLNGIVKVDGKARLNKKWQYNVEATLAPTDATPKGLRRDLKQVVPVFLGGQLMPDDSIEILQEGSIAELMQDF